MLSISSKNFDVLISELEINDAERLCKIGNDKELATKLGNGFPFPYTCIDAMAFIEQAAFGISRGMSFNFGIRLKKEASLIGICSADKLDYVNMNCEIGFWLGSDYRGKGYAYAAVTLLVYFAFNGLGMHRISAKTLDSNLQSRRLLEKIGFSEEGKLKESVRIDNKYYDAIEYGLLKTESADKNLSEKNIKIERD
ncbi:MAG: GNAT family N-acetyltransferase [Candidatus Micrarchaeia archaeon]